MMPVPDVHPYIEGFLLDPFINEILQNWDRPEKVFDQQSQKPIFGQILGDLGFL